MADGIDNMGPEDELRINVNETHEVQYWSARLGVTPEELHDAVAAVGPMVAAVRRELAQ